MDHAKHLAFARRFGRPLILAHAGDTSQIAFPQIETLDYQQFAREFEPGMEGIQQRRESSALYGWHSDLTPRINPASITLFRTEEVPLYGRDTTWANTAATYQGLAPAIRTFVAELWAEHRVGAGYIPLPGDDRYTRRLVEQPVASVHPVVRCHPLTGEPALLVNPQYTDRIVDMSRAESSHLLALLFEQTTRPENTVSFRWRPGDLAMWDNQSTWHLAPSRLPAGSRRVIHRIALAGPIPKSVAGKFSQVLAGEPMREEPSEN